MPELGEVARIVHFLRKHLTNRRIANVLTQDDNIVFNAKANTTAASFAAALKGRMILDARRQGKYFWLVLDKPPHPLFHFGMTGWVRLNCEETHYRTGREEGGGEEGEAEAGSDEEAEPKSKSGRTTETKTDSEWPPRFWKFILEAEGDPPVSAAFVDGRRLARIRLVDCPADQIRLTTPLKENGPDPVLDPSILTVPWLRAKMQSKKVPVKALLLDQANISGIGNWVADEVLFHARIHPEQYSNTFEDAQVSRLHESLLYVCGTACKFLADASKYPEDWLFKHRWDKGKKGRNVLPSGEKIVHLKVGGRTSAVVPALQRKTGPVAGDVDGNASEEVSGGEGAKGGKKGAKSGSGVKRKATEVVDNNGRVNGEFSSQNLRSEASGKGSKAKKAKVEHNATDTEEGPANILNSRKAPGKSKASTNVKRNKQAKRNEEAGTETKDGVMKEEPSRRRSSRLSK